MVQALSVSQRLLLSVHHEVQDGGQCTILVDHGREGDLPLPDQKQKASRLLEINLIGVIVHCVDQRPKRGVRVNDYIFNASRILPGIRTLLDDGNDGLSSATCIGVPEVDDEDQQGDEERPGYR